MNKIQQRFNKDSTISFSKASCFASLLVLWVIQWSKGVGNLSQEPVPHSSDFAEEPRRKHAAWDTAPGCVQWSTFTVESGQETGECQASILIHCTLFYLKGKQETLILGYSRYGTSSNYRYFQDVWYPSNSGDPKQQWGYRESLATGYMHGVAWSEDKHRRNMRRFPCCILPSYIPQRWIIHPQAKWAKVIHSWGQTHHSWGPPAMLSTSSPLPTAELE